MADILKEALARPAQKLGRMVGGASPMTEAERRYLRSKAVHWFNPTVDGPELDVRRARGDWLLELAYRHRLVPAPFVRDGQLRELLKAALPDLFPKRFKQTTIPQPEKLRLRRQYVEAMAILDDVEGLDMWIVRVGGKLVPVICAAGRAASVSEIDGGIELVGRLMGRVMEAGEVARFEGVRGMWVS